MWYVIIQFCLQVRWQTPDQDVNMERNLALNPQYRKCCKFFVIQLSSEPDKQ